MFRDWVQPKENRMPALLLGALVLTFCLVFFSTWQGLIHAWSSSDDYSHGFLVIPLCLYLLWHKRKELRSAPIKPSWAALPLVWIALFVYMLAEVAEIRTLSPLAMILFVGSSLLFLCGTQILKRCLFPLFLLLFMVPVPAQIYAELTIPLQLFVSKATVLMASSLGIPVLREGNVLYLPGHILQVVQACSGLRSIMSLVLLGTLIGYFSLQSNTLRTVLILFAIPVAVLVNIVRVMMIVMAFHVFDYDLTTGMVHTAVGVAVFGLAIVLFVLLRKVLALCER